MTKYMRVKIKFHTAFGALIRPFQLQIHLNYASLHEFECV